MHHISRALILLYLTPKLRLCCLASRWQKRKKKKEKIALPYISRALYCYISIICVLILLYMCPHATIAYLAPSYCYISTTHVSSYYYICVLILLYYTFVLILLYVSSYYYTTHVSSYYYTCVLIILHRWQARRSMWRRLLYADVCCMQTCADVC